MSVSIPSAKPPHNNEKATLNIAQTLNALQPSKRALRPKLFAEHYLHIEAALNRGVSETAIRKALATAGLGLSVGMFKKLLESEQLRRKNDPITIESKQAEQA